jgi:hypothetical protein
MAITRITSPAITSVASTAISGTLPAANINDTSISNITALPAGVGGKVLQVVNAHTGTQATSNSTTYTDTGLTATITPSSSSNKILVLIQQSVSKAGSTYANIRVYRDSTEIGGAVAGRSIGYTNTSTNNYVGMGFTNSFLDTPSSSSALVYKTQFNNNDADGTIRVQVDSGQSYMTLMEIAG